LLRHRALPQKQPEVLHEPLLREVANLLRHVVLCCWHGVLRRQVLRCWRGLLWWHMLPAGLFLLQWQVREDEAIPQHGLWRSVSYRSRMGRLAPVAESRTRMGCEGK
jgi:hypothetical protein